jgi:flagellar biogenesis protein FliO
MHMQKKWQTKILWLLIPPVLALLVFLGPLGGSGAAIATAATDPSTRLRPPPTPDLWQVASSLLGVLLIGAVAVMLIAKLRGSRARARPGAAGELLTLRQSLRISARQHLHAVEFDGRVLLLGECENNVTLVTSTGDPDARADEHAITGRRDELDGVDLLDTPAASETPGRGRPRTLASAAGHARTDRRRPGLPVAPPQTNRSGLATANLADFKSLLQRARKQAGV